METKKKSLKDWWTERTQNQKLIIVLAGIMILYLMNKNQSVNRSNQTTDFSTTKTSVEYCSYCGKEIIGLGTEQFGRKYCDLACYADDY